MGSISVVIPTRNGAATLPALLDAVARQRIDASVEVVAVDSGSTDGTVRLLTERRVKVVSIAPEAFDHGLTRNLGLATASGELAVLLVQDAVPASDDWLARLTMPFRSDVRLAGTFARQQPWPTAGAITRHYHAQYVASSSCARTVSVETGDELAGLTPLARLDRCTFDNVCSCVRRSIWERHPFRRTPIGEDIAWAKEVLLAGHRLAYVPDAVVLHSHERSPRYEFWRTAVLHRELFTLFGLRTIPTLAHLAQAMTSCLKTHLRLERNMRAAGLAVAWPLGQYVGGLCAARGWTMRPKGV